MESVVHITETSHLETAFITNLTRTIGKTVTMQKYTVLFLMINEIN